MYQEQELEPRHSITNVYFKGEAAISNSGDRPS